MSNFDERSGVVACNTSWGQWYQTIEEVYVEINVPQGTLAKQINIVFAPSQLTCVVRGETIIKGDMFSKVVTDECTWSLEDRKLVRIVLAKARASADNCWKSLLKSEFQADPLVFDAMEKKLTLEKFQKEYIEPGLQV
ncbi:nudC domain-containing protein 2-like isoform X2 [Amphiura filiformis]|uniref:nudC domain-containing protein 2-like isoform X2 n=1 Tax=Amphiura filiformis TaxID=82378 RepID=UPI003B21D077